MFGKNASRFFDESALFFTGPELTVAFLEPIDLLDVKLKIRLKAVGDVGGPHDGIDISGLLTYKHTDFHLIGL